MTEKSGFVGMSLTKSDKKNTEIFGSLVRYFYLCTAF